MTSATIKGQRGEIDAATAYPLEVFIQRTGLGRKAIAVLRRKGMPVKKAGRQAFIVGADFIEALHRSGGA